MYDELNNQNFDFVVFGSGISESIISSHLTKCGKKLLQLDISKFYGADCKNFNMKDIEEFISKSFKKSEEEDHKKEDYTDCYLNGLKLISLNNEKNFEDTIINENNSKINLQKDLNFEGLKDLLSKENFRDYNFDLNPKFLYSQSKATSNLSNSSAAKYMEFISMKKIYLLDNKKFVSTPCTKSEIFTSEDLDLFEKQKLLNFILAVMKINNEKMDVNTTIDIKKNIEMESIILQEITKYKEENYKIFFDKNYSKKLQKFLKIILANIDPNDENDYQLDFVLDRIYKHLSSLQIYDDCPLIYPNYGSSEFSQSLSRVCSVNGGIFIVNEGLKVELRRNISNLVDNTEKKFVVIVEDSKYNEKFTVLCDHLIINEAIINSNVLNIDKTLKNHDIKLKQKKKYLLKYSDIYIVKCEYKYRKITDGPILFKLPKEEKENFGLIAFEFFQGSNSTPKNRSLVEIFISLEIDDDSEYFENNLENTEVDNQITEVEICNFPDKDNSKKYIKNILFEKLKKSSNIFMENYLNFIEKQINDEHNSDIEKQKNNKEEKKENDFDDTKSIPNKVDTKILINFDCVQLFYNNENVKEENLINDKDVLITSTNHRDIDLDSYYIEAERIIKDKDWDKLEEKDNNVFAINEKNEDPEDDLIDDLFDSLNL